MQSYVILYSFGISRQYFLLRVEELRDSTAHAEMICIREASNQLRTWRLAVIVCLKTLVYFTVLFHPSRKTSIFDFSHGMKLFMERKFKHQLDRLGFKLLEVNRQFLMEGVLNFV